MTRAPTSGPAAAGGRRAGSVGSPPVARTQEERRRATRTRLVEAAVATLAEHGYAATTAKNVLEAAGVSAGGMYRHFPSMLDLVVAAAEEIREQQFAEFARGLERLGSLGEEECIELLRAACRRPVNGAWYDLLLAARTDSDLRERLTPFTEAYHRDILAFARTMPVASGWDPDAFATAIFSLIHTLDGEAITAVLHPQPELEAARTRMLAALLRGEPIAGAPRAAGPADA